MNGGPVFSYTQLSIESLTLSARVLGAFVERNFEPNIPGQYMVPSAGAMLGLTTVSLQLDFDNSSSEEDANGYLLRLFCRMKFFPWGDHAALAPMLHYTVTKLSAGDNDLDSSGIRLSFSLSTYF